MPDLVERLRIEHRFKADGLCVACTTPGQGTPQVRWPCALWKLADEARKMAEQKR